MPKRYQKFQFTGFKNGLNHEQRYFVYRWFELLNMKYIEFDSMPICGVRGQLDELLNVTQLVAADLFNKHHLIDVIHELYNCLSSDDVLMDSFLGSEAELMKEKLAELKSSTENFSKDNSFTSFISLVSSFSKKLNFVDFVGVYVEKLHHIMQEDKPNYARIDRIISCLLSELVYEGHSMQYLFKWGLSTFIHEGGDFFNKIERLSSLGKKNLRQFDVYFNIGSLKAEFVEMIQGYQDLIISNRLDHSSEIGARYLSNKSALKVKVNVDAVDIFSAMSIAREKVYRLVMLNSLLNPHWNYDSSLFPQYIFIEDICNLDFQLVKYEDLSPNVKISNISGFFKPFSGGYNNETKESLSRVLHWCRVANFSPDEGKFISLWGALEYILSGHSKELLPVVLRYATPFIGLYYFKRKLVNIQRLMQEDSRDKYEELEKQIMASKGQKVLRMGDFFEYICSNLDKVDDMFSDNDLLHRKSRWVAGCLSGDEILLRTIEEVEDKVSCDLKRMYRLRNMLTHRAHVEEVTLQSNLRWLVFYIQIILDNILHVYQLRPDYSIEELLVANEQSFFYYKKELKEYKYPDNVDFKNVVLPKELFI